MYLPIENLGDVFLLFFFSWIVVLFALLKSFEKFTSNVLVCVNSCGGPLWGFIVAFMLFNVKGIATAKWGHKWLFYACFGLIQEILNCGQMIILLVFLYIYIFFFSLVEVTVSVGMLQSL